MSAFFPRSEHQGGHEAEEDRRRDAAGGGGEPACEHAQPSLFAHGLGHCVGLEIHESPNLSYTNEKPLPVGAVTSVEPGIYLPGRFGVRIEDVVALGEAGCENLTRSPKNLIVL